jgi:hypothetical protein
MASVWNWLPQWTYGAMFASGLGAILGATLGALFTGFFTERGKQVAITRHFQELKKQLAANTELTKGIEGQLSREEWFGKGEFEYRCQQLSQLYGPLYGHLKTTQDLYELWVAGKLKAVNLPIKQLLARQNDLIIDLVRSKIHLLDEDEMPPCMLRLITSALIWNLYCPISEDGSLPSELAQDDRVRFPVQVMEYVVSKTEEIKRKRDELYARFAFRYSATTG